MLAKSTFQGSAPGQFRAIGARSQVQPSVLASAEEGRNLPPTPEKMQPDAGQHVTTACGDERFARSAA
jgi:hypothetical protein